MKEPIDDAYLTWLSAKVTLGDDLSRSYSRLLEAMYNFEFVWQMIGDDNRAEDGLDLRSDFLIAARLDDNPNWHSVGCSVLEMMIALADRADWQSDIDMPTWFWIFVTNLGLGDYQDDNFNEDAVTEILYNLVWRDYEFNGDGGMFPLREPQEDQREVEIWYQFSAYLAEHDEIGL